MNSRKFTYRLYTILLLCICICTGLFYLMVTGKAETDEKVEAGLSSQPLSAFQDMPIKQQESPVITGDELDENGKQEEPHLPSAAVDTMVQGNGETEKDW